MGSVYSEEIENRSRKDLQHLNQLFKFEDSCQVIMKLYSQSRSWCRKWKWSSAVSCSSVCFLGESENPYSCSAGWRCSCHPVRTLPVRFCTRAPCRHFRSFLECREKGLVRAAPPARGRYASLWEISLKSLFCAWVGISLSPRECFETRGRGAGYRGPDSAIPLESRALDKEGSLIHQLMHSITHSASEDIVDMTECEPVQWEQSS